ncbi:MAG: 4a-hydroxytetrahydrobiopterin dehydratase [Gallionella sp.]|nr:4a-hydroxytetrahydrobiopterin dehydratase [Gallionella sp.]
MDTASDLTSKRCKPCEGGMPPLTDAKADSLLHELDGWQRSANLIYKTFRFKDYYQTMAFVNAVAWMAHREDHHPDLMVGYNLCKVEYTTHAIHGLSENDFICAAKVDLLLKL